jgi:chemotaxis protein methyltransferase CheR
VNNLQWSDPAYETIARLISARTGLSFRSDQRHASERGIQRAMKRSQVNSLDRYVELIQYDVQTLNDAIDELTIGETYFFREPKHFAHIRRVILPGIRQLRGEGHQVRIWSAGCASGEEAYSLAIVCEEEGIGETSHILATDISAMALSRAREATYREWSFRGEGAAVAKKYLTFKHDRYKLDERIARRVQFEFLNLALDMYPSFATGTKGLDLILCRNVLIYFDRETVRAVARRLYDSLSDGGWLIAASGDPPMNEFAAFETVLSEDGVFYRRPTTNRTSNFQTLLEKLSEEATATRPIDEETVKFRVDEETVNFGRTASANAGNESHLKLSLAEAKIALDRGEYDQVVELTEGWSSDATACVLHLKALANIDTSLAVKKCKDFVQRHSLSPELQFLHAVLLMELNLDVEAVQAAQSAVFLDRTSPAAHFLLGSILQRRGSIDAAQRHFRNARNLCLSRPRDERVPMAESETAGGLAAAAEKRMVVLDAAKRNKI